MSYLRIGNGNSGGILVLPEPGVLNVLDLTVIGLNVSHALPSRWPPEPLARWEHLLWKEGKCEGKCWRWELLYRNAPLTFIYPVWNPIKNHIFPARVSDLLRWCSCGTGLNVQIIIPNVSLKTEWKHIIEITTSKIVWYQISSLSRLYHFVPHRGPSKVLDLIRNVRREEFTRLKVQMSRLKAIYRHFIFA